MRLSNLLAALAVPVAAVVYRGQVGDIDYHYDLLGQPLEQTTFFHRPRRDDRASLLYTLSDAGVLGAVNPGTGNIVWRQLLDVSTNATGQLVATDGEDWVAAGLGSSVHAWHAVSGRSVWWQDLGSGEVAGLEIVDGDVLALLREDAQTTLKRLDGATGRVVWDSEAWAGEPLGVHAIASQKAVLVSTNGNGLHAALVDLTTGRRISEHALGSGAGAELLYVGGSTATIAWADSTHSKVYVSLVDAKPHKFEFALPPDTAEVLVHTPRSPSKLLHLVVHARSKQQHSVQVLHVDGVAKTVVKAYELPPAPGAGSSAVSTSGEDVYITRITDDEMVLVGSQSPDVLGRWPLASTTLHAVGPAVAEVAAKPGGDGYAVRAAVVTDAQDWVLVRNGLVAWTRPEGLTGVVAAAFAEQSESEQLVRALQQEAHSSALAAFVHRVQRHFGDLEHLPAYVQGVLQRFVRSVLGGPVDAGEAADPFGFHKMAILATRRGRLYGIDAASPGTVRWSTQAVELPRGTAWAVQRIHVDEATGVATVFGQTAGLSVAVRVQTGEAVSAEEAPSLRELLARAGDDNDDAVIASTALVTGRDAEPWVLAIPADGRLASGVIPVQRCPHEVVVVRAGAGLQGVRFVVQGGQCVPEVTWTFGAPQGTRIASVATRPAHDPVASIGRVLGDRRVLYKYLNPNVAVVAAVDDVAQTLTTFVLDTVSGQVLVAATHAGVDGQKPIECVLFENSFACTFFGDYRLSGDGKAPATVKGYHLALSDMYESLEPNQRTGEGNLSSLQPLETVATDDSEGVGPAVVSQTWIVASELQALAVTQTRQGITVRELLAYLPGTHGILQIPRVGAVLDARRPVGRDPTPQEAEEGLTRYAPSLEIDPRMVASHERDVAGIAAIVTTPTHVESTTLVLAFGAVDVFGTRLAPSMAFDLLDRGFNKASMLATVAALAVGVAVLRPMVAKKQINMRWQAPA